MRHSSAEGGAMSELYLLLVSGVVVIVTLALLVAVRPGADRL